MQRCVNIDYIVNGVLLELQHTVIFQRFENKKQQITGAVGFGFATRHVHLAGYESWLGPFEGQPSCAGKSTMHKACIPLVVWVKFEN